MIGVKSDVFRSLALTGIVYCTPGATLGLACAPQDTLFSACEGHVKAELLVLPQEHSRTVQSERSITVTGTYSSGDRFGIEGLALKDGKVISGRFQSWDGGLLISPDGTAQIFNVARLTFEGSRYNLKDSPDRRAFLEKAEAHKLSFIQSHLLITEGTLDTQDIEGAPRFQRRILYADGSGALNLYDSGSRALTLYEAARELLEQHNAQMALNLDMGSYDFCEIETKAETKACGLLASAADSRLTNLLRFTLQ